MKLINKLKLGEIRVAGFQLCCDVIVDWSFLYVVPNVGFHVGGIFTSYCGPRVQEII